MTGKEKIVKTISNLGLSQIESEVYLSALELGECTIQEIAQHSKLKRTSLYYVLEKLNKESIVLMVKRNKKTYYLASSPKELMKRARERLFDFEGIIDDLEDLKHSVHHKPRVYFLHGTPGFKHVWQMLFESKCKEFMIITEGSNFLDFVKEKYILDEIIKNKKALGIKSRQLIVDSAYARKLIKDDPSQNRVSKLLPKSTQIPFTEIITDDFAAFISPRWDNFLFVTENDSFVKSRKSMFDLIWKLVK